MDGRESGRPDRRLKTEVIDSLDSIDGEESTDQEKGHVSVI